MELSTAGEATNSVASQHTMEPEGSLPWHKSPSESSQSGPPHPIISLLRSVLIMCSHLLLEFPTFLFSPIRATRPANPISLLCTRVSFLAPLLLWSRLLHRLSGFISLLCHLLESGQSLSHTQKCGLCSRVIFGGGGGSVI
jgi:hypothetical protein